MSKDPRLRVGDWVLVRFPAEETGKARKLSRPWHGPYRVVAVANPDVSITKVYFPQDGTICVHQSWVRMCPPEFPGGFFWYGEGGRRPGRPPRWVAKVLEEVTKSLVETPSETVNASPAEDGVSEAGDDTQRLDPDLDRNCSPANMEPDPIPPSHYPLRNRNRRRLGRTGSRGGVM